MGENPIKYVEANLARNKSTYRVGAGGMLKSYKGKGEMDVQYSLCNL